MAGLYSKEQIALANSVNLVDFLKTQGEKFGTTSRKSTS